MLAEFATGRPRDGSRAALFSVLVHAAVFLAIAVWTWHTPQIAHFKLPGTKKGVTLLTYYSPGSRRPSKMVPTVRTNRSRETKAEDSKIVAQAPPIPSQPARADAGSGNTAESGLGEGDVRIALQHYFPHPQPDLSALPHGTKGDVILNAVIDEHGKITALTLLKGIAPTIDDAVIATVKQWSFTPATKDGVPVASEQELLFHYERG